MTSSNHGFKCLQSKEPIKSTVTIFGPDFATHQEKYKPAHHPSGHDETGKTICIYTVYATYEVLALHNRSEAVNEIRKRISKNAEK